MKPSRYNIFIPQGNGECVVYNTLSDAIVLLDQEAKDSVQEGKIEDIDSDNLPKLADCNIIVEDNVDERNIVGYHYTLNKFKSRMVRFLVLTTNHCNLACPYCYQRGITPKKAMDTATADNLVMFIENIVREQRYKTLILGLYGGEPLLNLGCCSRICDKLRSWTEEKNVELDVILTTNGTLLSEDVINRLSPLSSVHVTLDGPRHIHDRKRFRRDRKGTYDKIIDGIHLLREKGIKTSIRINIAKDSLSALPSLLQDLKRFLNSDKIHVYTALLEKPCHIIGCGGHDLLYIPENEIDDTKDKLWRLGLEWGFDSGPKKDGPCSFVSDWTFTIDPFGNVYKCFEMAGSEQCSVGTIRNGGSVTWNYAHYDQMAYDPCQIPQCRDCIYLPKCYGGCPKDAQERNIGSSHDCEIVERKEKSLLIEVKRRMEVR